MVNREVVYNTKPKVSVNIIGTSVLRLARSVHDVSRANNNREAVVVCVNSARRASEMRKKLGISDLLILFQILKYHDDVIIH